MIPFTLMLLAALVGAQNDTEKLPTFGDVIPIPGAVSVDSFSFDTQKQRVRLYSWLISGNRWKDLTKTSPMG